MSASIESSPTVPAPGPRVAPHAGHAFAGILRLSWATRLTLRNMLALASVTAALSLLTYLIGRDNGGLEATKWLQTAVMQAVIPIMAFLAGAGAAREDLKPGAVDYVVTRPVRRWLYSLMKYTAQWTVVLPSLLLMFGVIWIVVQQVGANPAAPFRFWLTVAGAVTACGAVGFCYGTLSSRYIVLGLMHGVLIEGVVGSIPMQLNRFSILRQLNTILPFPEGESGAIGSSLLTLGLITLVMLVVAAVCNERREFIGSKNSEN